MSRVLVTGADGQLGKCIRKISEDFSDLDLEFHNTKSLDITDSDNIASIFSDGGFDYCINCAAYTNVEQAEKTPDPAYSINAEGARNLAEKCLDFNVTLIHISTDYVFDGKKEAPYKTTDKPSPINVYGASKLQGEIYIQEILKRFFIVRTSWLYSEFGKNFYKTILQKARAGEDLQITDEQTGCPTDANNLARVVLSLIASKNHDYGLHHFTDGDEMTWYGFAQRILLLNKWEDTVRLEKAKNYRTFAKRPSYSVLYVTL